MGIIFDKWENSPTAQLSDVCIEKYSLTISSQELSWLASWSCFNFLACFSHVKTLCGWKYEPKGGLQLITIILQAFVHFQVPQCLSVRAETAGAVLLFMSRFPCLNNKAEHKKRKINHRSCQSTEWKVVRSVLASSWISLVFFSCGWFERDKKKVAYTIFPLCLPLVSISSSSSIVLLHSLCCGPLGCLSTARSDFDICWNAQWSVQAWKDIQCFDPKPLVSFSSPFPFHQKLLCDIVHWHVGSQTKAWIYLNFHQWKTPTPTITPIHTYTLPNTTCIHTSAFMYTHITLRSKNTQIHNTQIGPSVKPQPLQFWTFNETSMFYEHTKTR